jgi:hypothetical protein
MEYLSRVMSSTSCPNAGDSHKNKYRLLRAMYEEVSSFAQTAEQKRQAQRLKQFSEEALVDLSKPTAYDKEGRLINVDPHDMLKSEELR